MGILVETGSGALRGVQEKRHQVFRGIPYARPPIGPLRFCAPQPPADWDGVRDASQFGASSIQGTSPIPGMAADGPRSEDCLYLNVYTPKADSAKRPVMFWVHGGGFTMGSSDSPLYDGGPLAERGDVVVVTINYRLGALGYLFLGDVGGHDWGASANCGQLDQILALKWVQENIDRFGGDPENVTIFGESAGSVAVVTLMAMPGARGLFHRVVAQSGSASRLPTREHAASFAESFLAELNLDPKETERLREIPVEEILKAQLKTLDRQRSAVALGFYFPLVDGNTLPRHPMEVIKEKEAKQISLMVGTNRDEVKLFKDHKNVKPILDEELERLVEEVRPKKTMVSAAQMIDIYKKSRADLNMPTENTEIYDAILSDVRFRIPCTRLAEAHGGAYLYLFVWESPAMRGALKACHALEMPFMFGTLHHPMEQRFAGTGPEAERLSDIMMDAWISFARNGDPNHEGMDTWQTYDRECRATMMFGKESACVNGPFEEERASWEMRG
jgi:para-nitrobenzyl esterase